MNKKNIFQILLITGCLSLICLLGACNEEDDIANNQVMINGNTAILTFTVGESDFNSEQINTRSTVPNDTVRQELGDGYVIETVIAPDTVSALTRGATSTTNVVRNNVKILVIAYRGNSLYKREVATVLNGKFAIHLPVGETFNLRFYAHNVPNQPVSTDFCTGTWKPGNTSESGDDSYIAEDNATLERFSETPRDMMWAKVDAINVTSTTKLPTINFKHLFCKVILNVTCDDDMTALTAVIGPKAFPNANVDISVDPNEENNQGWVGMGDRIETKIESTTTGGAKQLGGQTDLIPNESENITLGYEKITIFGQDYKTTTPNDLKLIFTRGHRYTITSKVRKDDLVTITYHPNGVTADDVMFKYKKGTKIALPEDTFKPPLEHVLYTWNEQSDGKGLDHENGDSLTLTANIDLYAIWKNPCVPGYDGHAYLWDAKTAFEGSFNDGSLPQSHERATHSAIEFPSQETMLAAFQKPKYTTHPGHWPEYLTIKNERATGGGWIQKPNSNRSTIDNRTRAVSLKRPSNKHLCDNYVFLPCRGTEYVDITRKLNGDYAYALLKYVRDDCYYAANSSTVDNDNPYKHTRSAYVYRIVRLTETQSYFDWNNLKIDMEWVVETTSMLTETCIKWRWPD